VRPLAGFDYSRSGNPTRAGLEACLRSLEGGEACAAFSSGLAACSAVLQSLRPGDGVAASHDLYGGTFRLLDKVFAPWGLEVAFAQNAGLDAYERAIGALRRPRLLWIETPTNPLLDVLDIVALSDLARKRGMLSVVDNTFATSYLQRPLELGADLVVHSTTKYASGHSDVVSGAVIARSGGLLEGIRFLQNATGAIPGPLDCYLVQRGLKTLAVRMDRHCANAQALAESLVGAKGIRRVVYPGLDSHPGHALAARQMRGFGGMVSVELEGGAEAARRFFIPGANLRLRGKSGRRGIVVLSSRHYDSRQRAAGNQTGARDRRRDRAAQCGDRKRGRSDRRCAASPRPGRLISQADRSGRAREEQIGGTCQTKAEH